MKILHVYPYYPPAEEFGGVINVVARTAENLATRGHDVTVYTTDTGGPTHRLPAGSVTASSVEIQRYRNINNWLAASGMLPIPPRLGVALRRNLAQFDAVHVHGYSHLPAVATAWEARRQSVPYVLTPHGSIDLPDDLSEGRLRRAFDTVLGEFVVESADAVVALTPDEYDRIRGRYPDSEIVTIPNGINTARFDVTDEQIESFRREHGLTETLNVMFIGRLNRIKGLDVLIEVADRFDGRTFEGKEVKFVIVGGDDGFEKRLREEIVRRDVENVSLLGYFSDSEVTVAHTAADVFLLPSYSEGQPVSALEACAASTPVVISDACSLPVVEEADAGLVVGPEADDVEAALQSLLERSERRRQLGENARELAEGRFSWDRVVEQLERLYADLAAERDTDH